MKNKKLFYTINIEDEFDSKNDYELACDYFELADDRYDYVKLPNDRDRHYRLLDTEVELMNYRGYKVTKQESGFVTQIANEKTGRLYEYILDKSEVV